MSHWQNCYSCITPGVLVQDDPKTNSYPMPITVNGKNDVFVGRIRRDFSNNNSLNLWVVADNLRKGAATNTVQLVLEDTLFLFHFLLIHELTKSQDQR